MKKQIITLVLGAVALATNPAFAMLEGEPQGVSATKVAQELTKLEEAYEMSRVKSAEKMAERLYRVPGCGILGLRPELMYAQRDDNDFPQMRAIVQRTQELVAEQEGTTLTDTSWAFGNAFMREKMALTLLEEVDSKK